MVGTRSARGTRWACGLVLLFALPATSLAEEVRLAIQPTVVDGEEAELDGFNREIRASLGPQVALVDADVWMSALGSDPASCTESDACLRSAAKRSGATHVLHVTVAPYAPRVTVAARVLDREGGLARRARTVEVESRDTQRRGELARETLRKVLAGLELARLEVPEGAGPVKRAGGGTVVGAQDPHTPPPVGPGTVVGAQDPVTSSPAAQRFGVMRLLKYGAFGMGGVAAAGGVALALMAHQSASELEPMLVDRKLPAGNPTARELFARSEAQRTQAWIVGAVGGALLATGAVLSLMSEGEGPKVGAMANGSGAALSVSGSF